jgi:hypothetical protein
MWVTRVIPSRADGRGTSQLVNHLRAIWSLILGGAGCGDGSGPCRFFVLGNVDCNLTICAARDDSHGAARHSKMTRAAAFFKTSWSAHQAG